MCRNLPFDGRAMRGSRVRLPREEGTRSRHQRLFEENVGKTGKDTIYELLSERFGSYIYARGRYQHPTRPSQRTTTFNQVCEYDFNLFYVPFYVFMSFCTFYIFYLFVVDEGVSLAPMYSSICDKEIRPTQFFENQTLVKLFLSLFCKICFY